MRQEMERLVQLQNIDQTIKNLKQGKQDLDAKARAAEEKAVAADRRLDEDHAESKSFRVALDQREMHLKSVEEKIARLEIQLNTIKTNREYTALQHEIMGFKADKSRVEDEILQMMEQIEADRARTEHLHREAEEARRQAEAQREAVQVALQDADARIERLTGEREALARQIPADFLTPYERLRRKGDGRAMAACRNFICVGCRMSLTANTVNLLMAGEKLVYCHSCGRILYIASDQDIHGGIGAGRKIF